MYELLADFLNGNWLYFKTDKTTCWEAWEELCNVSEKIGLDLTNMTPQNMELRGEHMVNIDEV